MDDATSWDSISDDEACSPHADVINDGAPTVFAPIKISSENLQLFRFVPSVVFEFRLVYENREFTKYFVEFYHFPGSLKNVG